MLRLIFLNIKRQLIKAAFFYAICFFILSKPNPIIIKLAKNIEYASRCRITSIVNNTNLAYLSSVKDITDSFALIDDVSKKMNVPVKFISGKEEILSKLPPELKNKLFPLELFMHLPFDAFA